MLFWKTPTLKLPQQAQNQVNQSLQYNSSYFSGEERASTNNSGQWTNNNSPMPQQQLTQRSPYAHPYQEPNFSLSGNPHSYWYQQPARQQAQNTNNDFTWRNDINYGSSAESVGLRRLI